MADDKKDRLREIIKKNGSATMKFTVHPNEPTELERARASNKVQREMENRRKL